MNIVTKLRFSIKITGIVLEHIYVDLLKTKFLSVWSLSNCPLPPKPQVTRHLAD